MNRRDFLKLSGLAPLSLALPGALGKYRTLRAGAAGLPNILVVVFDAWSAAHLPFYGYPRNTTPNIQRLSSRAIVYHRHYAGGNLTTPGTASLLTGVPPWQHRAFHLNATVAGAFVRKNIFSALPEHYRIAYSHNPVANILLRQFASDLDDFVPLNTLMLTSDSLVYSLFGNDADTSDVAWIRTVKKDVSGYSYSLFLSYLYEKYMDSKVTSLRSRFPRGIPSILGDNYFTLEDAINWVQRDVPRLPEPYLGYFHFMPPHEPYTPEMPFYRQFAGDGYQAPIKPDDVFSKHLPPADLARKRTQYDEYIVNLDWEFGRLVDGLESSGQLDNTWLVLTSDHGELFERGFRGHGNPLVYEGVIRVPLVIFEPGRTSRLDIGALTTALDVLPTLAHIGGSEHPAWAQGSILPPFPGSSADSDRSIFVAQATATGAEAPIAIGTIAMIKGNYKLSYFIGYPELAGRERVELYDVIKDPEELQDLAQTEPQVRDALLAELKAKLAEMNQPYT